MATSLEKNINAVRLGQLGGQARARVLKPEERSAIAREAVKGRRQKKFLLELIREYRTVFAEYPEIMYGLVEPLAMLIQQLERPKRLSVIKLLQEGFKNANSW